MQINNNRCGEGEGVIFERCSLFKRAVTSLWSDSPGNR